MELAITLRPMTDADLQFSCQVYAETRDDIAAQDWTNDEKDELVRSQFRLQHTYYQEYYPNAQYDLIVADGSEVGRLYVDRNEEELRIIDIAFLARHRGKGLGGAIMRALLAEASRENKPVRIHVDKENRAMRLYERLGFRVIEDRGAYEFMEWTPHVTEKPAASNH